MSKARWTQNKWIVQHLQLLGSITSMKAFQTYGITRLSGRIYELRKQGHKIMARVIQTENTDGNMVRYNEYYLSE